MTIQEPKAMAEFQGGSCATSEIPGKRPDVAPSVSNESIRFCQPCINVPATAFCTDCSDYFCSPCTDYHRKLALTKNHNLFVGSAMPSCYPGKHVGATAEGKCTSCRKSLFQTLLELTYQKPKSIKCGSSVRLYFSLVNT